MQHARSARKVHKVADMTFVCTLPAGGGNTTLGARRLFNRWSASADGVYVCVCVYVFVCVCVCVFVYECVCVCVSVFV